MQTLASHDDEYDVAYALTECRSLLDLGYEDGGYMSYGIGYSFELQW